MQKSQAKFSSFKLNSELGKLHPSAIIDMYEIDISDIAFEQGIYSNELEAFSVLPQSTRIEKNIKLQTYEWIPVGSSGTSGTGKPDLEENDEIGEGEPPWTPPKDPVDPNPPDIGDPNDPNNPPNNPDPPEEPNPPIIDDPIWDEGGNIINPYYSEDNLVFRFHNSINLTRSDVYWQNKRYIAAPILAEGFELSSKGTQPTPTLELSLNEESETEYIALLKQSIAKLGGLVGAKVTRIRTFVKHLDEINFQGKETPDEYDPDPNVEFPRDIFFVERKESENKYGIKFQLASLLDLEGIFLPSRRVISNRCPWRYRGYGCCYEYASRQINSVHGKNTNLPPLAPPVANTKNEKIKDLIDAEIIDQGKFSIEKQYKKGHAIYIEKSGIKYYFVAKEDFPPLPPPNLKYWEPDQCAKDVTACKLRWYNINVTSLPFGGYAGVGKSR